ncbi:ShlB/FhaC/HecB family hemolysin secretion/activation protein [Roseomonas sp. CCTCC AB2023176]|uniref:ShlB/FhaC/HecB family hemolysin secretion/activation protein n=1 Tax=Roseomonas sp. CCTCC AB2023176 TaxID=3342640 RepID=UPI0035DAA9A7
MLVALPAADAFSQSAGQITPPSFAPVGPTAAGTGLDIRGEAGAEIPSGAETLSVRVGRVVVTDGLAPMEAETRTLAAPLEGRSVRVADLFRLARALEEAYARRGYVLARVVLPSQRLADGGDVRLLVVDGAIGRVDTSSLPPPIRDRVESLILPLVGRGGLTLSEIERRLLLAGDTPGTALRSTLSPGDAPGTTTLVVEARHQPVSGFVSYDNTLSSALGRSVLGFGLDLNSVLRLGEQVYLRASGYPGSEAFDAEPRNRTLAGGIIVPIGTDGLTANLEATQSKATPRPVAGAVNFTSTFERLSLRLRYPLLRGRTATLSVEGAFDIQSELLESTTPFSARLALDELRIARLAMEGFAVLPGGGILAGRVTGSQGIAGLGARSCNADLPLSRIGARPDLTKLEAALRFDQPLLENLAVQISARAQMSFGAALPRSEQIGLVTTTGLSAFDAGAVQGDSGYVIRGELQAPLSTDAAGVALGMAPYIFGAFGAINLEQPSAVERRSTRATAYGIGLRLAAAPTASFSGVTLSVEYGRADRSDLRRTEDRVTVVTLLRF